ncbi:caspase 8 L homeolog [Xenopus laevis]|uniref:Caspase-8 n=1 Tax=Xenopus laevis TaxID=8355 RepID=Q9IB64_XENLA|nr:caspase 8 L homeolog [Xenopus laevis]BAA94749.1 caspase-8 [Xenopus laevis]
MSDLLSSTVDAMNLADMNKLLFEISEDLDKTETLAMIFLCEKRVTAQEKENIKDAKTLFLCLKKKDLICYNDLSFLKELLYRIGRNDLLRGKLGVRTEEIKRIIEVSPQISPYRILLYDISQGLSKKEVEDLKYLLDLSTAKTENASILEIFLELEKVGKLHPDDLQKLKHDLETIGCKNLSRNIEDYERISEADNHRPENLPDLFEKISVQEEQVNCTAQEPFNGEQRTPQPETESDYCQPQQHSHMNLETYHLEKNPHGWCVVINNYDFKEARSQDCKYTDREGTAKDAEEITRIFNARGYITEEHRDLTAANIQKTLEMYSKKDHAEKDSFVCFILSHGGVGTVCGCDGEEVEIKRLTKYFNGQHCRSLINKPKIFFIQACQGKESHPKVDMDMDTSFYEPDANGSHLPLEADFLTAFATVEDYTSLRHRENGSIYIQQLCKALTTYTNQDLIDILTSVNSDVANMLFRLWRKNVTQMPSFKSELRKKLILPPPNAM